MQRPRGQASRPALHSPSSSCPGRSSVCYHDAELCMTRHWSVCLEGRRVWGSQAGQLARSACRAHKVLAVLPAPQGMAYCRVSQGRCSPRGSFVAKAAAGNCMEWPNHPRTWCWIVPRSALPRLETALTCGRLCVVVQRCGNCILNLGNGRCVLPRSTIRAVPHSGAGAKFRVRRKHRRILSSTKPVHPAEGIQSSIESILGRLWAPSSHKYTINAKP